MTEAQTKRNDWATNPQQARALTIAHGSRRFYKGVRSYFAYADEWYTPAHIVHALGPFDLDPCAGPMTYAERNVSREENGLSVQWHGRVWCNPPYSILEEFLDKFLAHGNGIALVNNRTETLWFQTLGAQASGLFFIRRRVKFGNPDGPGRNSTTGSVLVAVGKENAQTLKVCTLEGFFAAPGGSF